MGKFGILGVFVVVVGAHLFVLQSAVHKKEQISKPKAKVHRITLSRVCVKTPIVVPPKPKVEPIILPPDPEPIEEVQPIVKPVVKQKPVKKKKHKKRVVKKRIKKPEPIVEPVKEVIVQPVIEQVVAPKKVVDTSSIKDAYTSEIRRQIKTHLYYPKIAKRMRMQGIVKVSFLVLADGSIRDIRVLSGAKSVLKKAAIKTIKLLRLKPLPDALGQTMVVTVPVGFNIKGL